MPELYYSEDGESSSFLRSSAGWSYDAGATVFYTSPIVRNGTVYVGAGSTLFALDAGTGAEDWVTNLQSTRVVGMPVLQNGVVYTTHWDDAGYYLSGLDAQTGDSVIDVDLSGPPSDFLIFREGLLWIQERSAVEAFDPDTGEIVHSLSSSMSDLQLSVAPSQIYLGGVEDSKGKLKAYEIDDLSGGPVWETTTITNIQGAYPSPSVSGAYIYCAGDGTDSPLALWKVNRHDGTVDWKSETPQSLIPAVVDDDVVYVADNGGAVTEVVTADGSINWTVQTSGSSVEDVMLASGESLLVPTDSGMSELDRSEGTEVSFFDATPRSPAVGESIDKSTFSGYLPDVSVAFSGLVTDANGDPVEGAQIEVASDGQVLGYAQTDENGEYDVGEAEPPLSLSLQGDYTKEVLGGHEEWQFAGVKAILSNPEDSAPLDGVTVQIDNKQFVTDSDGQALNPYILPDETVIAVAFNRFSMEATPTAEGEIVTLDFTENQNFPEYRRVTVNVRDSNGNEIDDVSVSARPSNSVSATNDSGRAQIMLAAESSDSNLAVGRDSDQYRTARVPVEDGTQETEIILVEKTQTVN